MLTDFVNKLMFAAWIDLLARQSSEGSRIMRKTAFDMAVELSKQFATWIDSPRGLGRC